MGAFGAEVAGNYPRRSDVAGAQALLHSQQRGADVGTSAGSYAAYKAWKKGLSSAPVAMHSTGHTFGAATYRDPQSNLFSGESPAGYQQKQQQQPQRTIRSRNPVTWDGEPEEAPRTTWDPLRREETSKPQQRTIVGSVSEPWASHRAEAQLQRPPQQPDLAGMEKENPSATWGQLDRTASARKRGGASTSAALSMIDGESVGLEPPRNNAPRLPSDNLNYLGLRLPGQRQQNHGRSYGFTSQFSDPILNM